MIRILLAAFFFVSSAQALLPPYAQSVREIEAIINSDRLYQLLGSAEAIQDIRRTDGGYVVTTRNYVLEVKVHFQPSRHIGPASFMLEFGELTPNF